MFRRRLRAAPVGLLLIALNVGCGSTPDRPAAAWTASPSPAAPAPPVRGPHSPDPGLPYEGAWTLVSGTAVEGPIPISEDYPIRLELRARQANGKSTCNGYGGRFRITGTSFRWARYSPAANDAGCPTEEGLTAENRYLSSFVDVDAVYADESTLRLTGPGVELVYERLPAPDLSELVDVTWAAGDFTMRLSSDGTFRKTNGCWVSVGEWGENAGLVIFPSAHTKKDCANRGDGPYAPEEFTFSVRGDRLTVTGDGETVVYCRKQGP